MNRSAGRCRGEDGITLSELLIAMVITAIIVVPLAGAMFVGLRSSMTAQNRVEESAAANILSSYFGPDVQNTVAVATGVAEPASACGGGALGSVGLLLTTEFAPNTTTPVASVAYYRGSGADQTTLYRRVCAGAAASAATPVIRNLAAAPTFSCAPDCGGGWRSVKVVVQQRKATDVGSSYTSTVEAARRDL
jgi:hypothetical protein